MSSSDLELLFSLIWADECHANGRHDLEPEREFKFHPLRKYRFDFAWPRYKVAVEIDGGIWMAASGHKTALGTHADRSKGNWAAASGWLVLRYDEKHLADMLACDIYKQVTGAMTCPRGQRKGGAE